MCTIDEDYWHNICPLICFYVVEYHLPHRVARQFGHLQNYPPDYYNTSHNLHEYVFFICCIPFKVLIVYEITHYD
jgi:hypothetical protein